MAGEGEILRQARETKGWSLGQAEEATKIRVRYLKALEEEQYSVLPGSTYTKGFLRTYARHLGLDPDAVIAQYKATTAGEVAPPPAAPLAPIATRPIWLRPAVAAIMAVLAVIAVIGIAHWSSPEGQTANQSYSPPPVPSTPKVESTQPAVPKPGQAQAQSSSPGTTSAVTAAEQQGLIAQLVFTQNCWLVVEADGQLVLQGTYAPGTTKELRANEKITLVTVGNAGGLTITLNGKTLPSLGESGEVKRNVVLTKDTVPK